MTNTKKRTDYRGIKIKSSIINDIEKNFVGPDKYYSSVSSFVAETLRNRLLKLQTVEAQQ